MIFNWPMIGLQRKFSPNCKGSYQNGSDIDLCLVGDKLATKFLFKLGDELDDLMLPYSFNLSIYHKIDNPEFTDHIDRGGIIFYSSFMKFGEKT